MERQNYTARNEVVKVSKKQSSAKGMQMYAKVLGVRAAIGEKQCQQCTNRE